MTASDESTGGRNELEGWPADEAVLGVLTGQVPVRSMPVATATSGIMCKHKHCYRYEAHTHEPVSE